MRDRHPVRSAGSGRPSRRSFRVSASPVQYLLDKLGVRPASCSTVITGVSVQNVDCLTSAITMPLTSISALARPTRRSKSIVMRSSVQNPMSVTRKVCPQLTLEGPRELHGVRAHELVSAVGKSIGAVGDWHANLPREPIAVLGLDLEVTEAAIRVVPQSDLVAWPKPATVIVEALQIGCIEIQRLVRRDAVCAGADERVVSG
jgi:hypothetical protein